MKQMIFITLQYMMVILILYKAIENTTLGDLNLTGLTHTKMLQQLLIHLQQQLYHTNIY
jgi:hypothetical protein